MTSRVCSLFVILLVISATANLRSVGGTDAVFQRVDIKGSKHFPGLYNIQKIQVTKFNRTASVFNMDFELEVDLDDTYTVHLPPFPS